jgi:transcription initiation factor IIE alpha subunit
MKNEEIVGRLDNVLEELDEIKRKAKIDKETSNFNGAIEKLTWYRNAVQSATCPHCNENLKEIEDI